MNVDEGIDHDADVVRDAGGDGHLHMDGKVGQEGEGRRGKEEESQLDIIV